jgi:hypothetical protein
MPNLTLPIDPNDYPDDPDDALTMLAAEQSTRAIMSIMAAGASLTEAADWYATQLGGVPPYEWAAYRRVTPEQVCNNIEACEPYLQYGDELIELREFSRAE